MIRKDDYARRIAAADRVELVVINFELIADYLREAKENKEDKKLFEFNIGKSREFLREMKLALDMQYDISKEYLRAYRYIDRLEARYLFGKSDEIYNAAMELIGKFINAWKNLKEEGLAPVMQNTEQMYAGLTYGKGGQLNEYVESDGNRGYKA